MTNSVPASRNALPLHIAKGKAPSYRQGVIATRQTPTPVIGGSGSTQYGRAVLTHNLIRVNALTPANRAAVAPHSPIPGINSIKSISSTPRRGVPPGGVQPGMTTAAKKA